VLITLSSIQNNIQELKHTLSYLHSELNRLETMAGTLSTVEEDHFRKLTNFDHSGLTDIAVEEQSAARQLGTMKQMCLSMAQKVDEMKKSIESGQFGERAGVAETH
jgi:anti-sigma28 factor (negative regulator of flagellin synthesis)